MQKQVLILFLQFIIFLGLSNPGEAHATETLTYYHLDALGSPVAASDEQGTVIWRET